MLQAIIASNHTIGNLYTNFAFFQASFAPKLEREREKHTSP